jgi:hypothetical protein
MQLIYFIGTACVSITVVNINNAIVIDVFFRIANTIIVQVPAGLPCGTVSTIGAISAISAISTVSTVVSFASCQPESEGKGEQEKGVSEYSMPTGHYCVSKHEL